MRPHFILRRANQLTDALDQLRDLAKLDANLTSIEETFSHHFRLAGSGLPTEVVRQQDAFRAAKAGIKAAKAALVAIETVLKTYPEDKTAQRAAKDADVMIRRFERHKKAAYKIVQALTKKALPPALKKMGAAATRALKKHLIDPGTLRVEFWQTTGWYREKGSTNYYGDYRPGNRVNGVVFQMDFWINGVAFTLGQFTGSKGGVYIGNAFPGEVKTTTAATFVAHVIEQLGNWEGIKGRGKANKARGNTAFEVAMALKDFMEEHGDTYGREPKVSPDNAEIDASTRQDVRQEDYGEYDDQWRETESWLTGQANKALRPWNKHIKEIQGDIGEKGWFSITVKLK